MKTYVKALMLITVIALICSSRLSAQTEGQKARTAEKYFVSKQYDKAAELFAQLVSSNPKNYKYNYYYGVSLLISGKNKEDALPYLESAMQNNKSPEDIYYYMGRALHLTYNFDEALRSFAEFNNFIGAKNTARWSTPQYMSMCNNAKKILDTSKNNLIEGRTEVLANEFYDQYKFASPNGKLLSMPDEIIKAMHIGEDERPMIFLSGNGRVMYYSAMNPESNSRDIYRMEKDLDNNWGQALCLDNTVNSKEDEILPTCNNDGRILYFSSRGHSSTGGFDIMKSYYNTVSKTWTVPENLGSPFNSPDDDFCFVASAAENTAYITSQREAGMGHLTVFKIKYSNKEELPIALNGRFNCINNPSMKSAHLIVSRDGEDKIVADLNTDSVSGTYALELPGPGTYRFKVEASGYETHTEDVTFASYSENILVQDIYLNKNINGKEDLAITNRRLTESGLLDESLTAEVDENGNVTNGISAKDLAVSGKLNTNGQSTFGKVDPATGMIIHPDGTMSYPGESGVNDKVNVPSIPQGIYFKVQIGAFRHSAKEIVQKRLEKKTDKTMLTWYFDLTWLRYFIGTERTYVSAKNLKHTLAQAGFKDAFVVAFQNEKPMNLFKAIQATQVKKN